MKVFTKLFAFCALLCVMTACPSNKQTDVAVTTNSPSNVTYNSAICSCNAKITNGIEIKEIGLCWNTTGSPTLADDYDSKEWASTSFTTTLKDLEMGKTYYVRGFVKTNDIDAEPIYGNEINFTTEAPIEVTTIQPSDFEYTTAKCGVEITLPNNSNLNITKIGVCWSIEEMPTINSSKLESDYLGVSYTPTLENLEPGETYHVRAYAKGQYNTPLFYGPDVTFTLKEASENAFLVDNNRFVYFSPGNLQYQASTNIWRFAENQYDFIGEDNNNVSETYDGWIDLFGWATSGYCCGNENYQPYHYTFNASYGPIENHDLTGEYQNCDWGIYNPISNGGNQAGIWRTPTTDEWEYVMNIRPNAKQKRVNCNINGINGVIIMPDNHIWPNGIGANHDSFFYSDNTYSLSDWETLQNSGAIFFPEAGYRNVKYPIIINGGYYWSSTYSKDIGSLRYANSMYFEASFPKTGSQAVYQGCSVRLVKDATF